MKKLTKALVATMAITALALPMAASAADWNLSTEHAGDVIEAEDPEDLINPILMWVFGIIGLVCVIMIVYAGVRIATSGDKEEERKKYIKMLTWALIGLVIVLIAFALVNIIGSGITGAFS